MAERKHTGWTARLLCALALALLAPLHVAQAQQQDAAETLARPLAEDPELEQRVLTLSHELRCLVCQNQSVAESNAPLAVDLRDKVREQMRAGRSDDEIRSYMVERYGDFVLYTPPLKGSTVLLWTLPGLLFLAGIVMLVITLRRRTGEARPALSEQERARALKMLEADAPAAPSDTREPPL